MPINYGSIDRSKRKPRRNHLMNHGSLEASHSEPITAEALERRLQQLATQNRAPSVAKAATTELLERKAPKKQIQDAGLTAGEANRIADIYERLFGQACPNCGYIGEEP